MSETSENSTTQETGSSAATVKLQVWFQVPGHTDRITEIVDTEMTHSQWDRFRKVERRSFAEDAVQDFMNRTIAFGWAVADDA